MDHPGRQHLPGHNQGLGFGAGFSQTPGHQQLIKSVFRFSVWKGVLLNLALPTPFMVSDHANMRTCLNRPYMQDIDVIEKGRDHRPLPWLP